MTGDAQVAEGIPFLCFRFRKGIPQLTKGNLLGTRQVGWNGYRLTGIVIVVVGEPFVSESSGLAASKEEV